MKVKYSPRAISDLFGIAEYLKAKSISGSLAIDDKIQSSIRLIGELPRSGRVLEGRPNVRIIPVARAPYLIFYAIKDDAIIILHIRHASRKPVHQGDL